MKILHIEVSKMIRTASRDIIEAMTHEYFEARGMEEAFEVLDKEKINLIITALELKDIEGELIIERLSGSPYKDIPVVVLTSTDSLELRRSLFDMGVVDYQIKKYFTPERLKGYIETIQLSDALIEKLRAFKIAVVDDSILTINVIRNIFRLNQIKYVDYYYDAESLLQSGLDYQLYIIDLILPETSGEELIYRLKEINDDNIIILISSSSNYKTISHILNTGANDFIVKPFDANTFIIRIKSHVRTYLLMKELEEKNKALLELSVTDGLTKIYNHRYMIQQLKEEVKRADRYKHDLSIILLDLDNFKRVNDTYGHQTGDEVLRCVARVIGEQLREGDVLGRYGGEEFLVILPETNVEDARRVGEKLREAVRRLRYDEQELLVTVSGGIAGFTHFDYSAMIKQADINLYKAKTEGKDRII